jgi:hypothetical protein
MSGIEKLERKYAQADSIVYIGQEANDSGEQALDVRKAQEFVNKQEIMENGNLNFNTLAVMRFVSS